MRPDALASGRFLFCAAVGRPAYSGGGAAALWCSASTTEDAPMKLSLLLFAAVGAAAFHAVMAAQKRQPQASAGASPASTDPRDFSRPAGPAADRSLELDDPEVAV